MSKHQQNPLSSAHLSWSEQGEPSSILFDDIYFSTTDGIAETNYVFIEQNKLLSRWLATKSAFHVIAETGFGSGLNLLVTWQLFQSFRQKNPQHPLKRLYFISFEKYPFSVDDLRQAHQRWPNMAALSTQLYAQYPSAIAGCHRLNFDLTQVQGSVIVDLWFGDINETLPQVDSSNQGLVDTWYLDGFAPSKNPDMWQQTLYDNMARISKHNASMATFTAAGDVRRGLIKAGFTINKAKGFGKKREMLTGQFSRPTVSTVTNPWFYRPSVQVDSKSIAIDSHITIIGGGIASAALALALTNRQIPCRILCQDSELAGGASGNLQGGLYPLLNPNGDMLSQFYSQAFEYAKRIYRPYLKSDHNCGDFCGVVQLSYNDKTRTTHEKIIDSQQFPPELVRAVDAKTASQLSGLTQTHGGLYYASGGWVAPKALTEQFIKAAQATGLLSIHVNTSVKALQQLDSQWLLTTAHNEVLQARYVVLANGHGLSRFEQTQQLPLYATAGQVSHISASQSTNNLKTLLCYQGYMTPTHNNNQCLGATFNRDTQQLQLTDEQHRQNIDKFISDIPSLTTSQQLNEKINGGKVGVRLSAKDHLPMVGAVPHFSQTHHLYQDLNKGRPAKHYPPSPVYHNLFMLGGLGARGLCSAPILAEILACQLSGEPLPLANNLLQQLNPNRYWIKQLKKHHVNI